MVMVEEGEEVRGEGEAGRKGEVREGVEGEVEEGEGKAGDGGGEEGERVGEAGEGKEAVVGKLGEEREGGGEEGTLAGEGRAVVCDACLTLSSELATAVSFSSDFSSMTPIKGLILTKTRMLPFTFINSSCRLFRARISARYRLRKSSLVSAIPRMAMKVSALNSFRMR